MSLNASERETVILGSDAEDLITIWTAQRATITRLRGNPSARETESGFYGTSAWAKFEMPANLLSFRSGRIRLTDEQRQARADLMRRNRERRS